MHCTDILLRLVDERRLQLQINSTTQIDAKSNMSRPSAHKRVRNLDPVMQFRARVLAAARDGDIFEVAQLLSIIDDAENDTTQ